MQDELRFIYIVHGGDPKKCRRCYASTRPPCRVCGHALSGRIESGINQTTCEVCGTVQIVSFDGGIMQGKGEQYG
jgi:hypothetical protein